MRAPSQKVSERPIPVLLHVDDALVVVDKPSGELVHPGWGRGEATTMSRARDALGEWVYPVHRLDRATSGLVVLARHPEAAHELSEQWRRGEVVKGYLALVRGVPSLAVEVDHPVRKGEQGDERVAAVTAFRRRAVSDQDRCSLVEAAPRTGRLHQIRRHLKHLSHPIIGDVTYGDGRMNRQFRATWNIHRLCLHACRLALRHPGNGLPIVFEAPPPPELEAPWRALGLWP